MADRQTIQRGRFMQLIDWRHAPAGTQYTAGLRVATVLPDKDFETYSEAGYVWHPELRAWKSLPGLAEQNRGLPAVGTRNYVQHPTFRPLCLAYNLKDIWGEQQWIPSPQISRYTGHNEQCSLMMWGKPCDCPAFYHPVPLLEHVAAGKLIEAWNVYFEWQVWNFYCVPVLGWPVLAQEQCRCAMAKARASAYPGKLKHAGAVLKLVEQKDKAGDTLVRKLTVPRNPTKGNPELRWTPITAAEDFEKFYQYNRQDIRSEAEASVRVEDQTPRELAVWLADFRINMRGMQIDLAAVDDCIAIIEQAEARDNGRLRELTNGRVQSYSEVARIVAWARDYGVHFYKLDENAVTDALKRTDYPAAVLEALRIRQRMAYGSVKKFYALRAQTTPSGRLYDQYAYYGAHTSLWNGQGVQPANLYKGIFSKPEEVEKALAAIHTRCLELVEYEFPEHDALEIVASCLRSMVIAAPGHRLISSDFTSIQAVATSCMAGEDWRIEVFRTHGKIYEAIASLLTGKPLQFYLDYRKRCGKHHPDRQLGKLAALSADFGAWIGGWKRFGADEYGDDAFIKDLILRTRARIPNIVKFWGGQTVNKFNKALDGSYAQEQQLLFGLEGAAISAVLEPGKCFSSRPGSHLGVLYQMHGDTLYCHPPSGGYIRYHAPRLAPSERDYASPWEYELTYEGWNSNQQKGPIGWIRMGLYGGVCTQNVISHMCREVQADKILRLEAHGYPVVMHTHDEDLDEVPNDRGSLEEYNRLVRILPAWAICLDGQPWPIRVPDAWEAMRYGKWED